VIKFIQEFPEFITSFFFKEMAFQKKCGCTNHDEFSTVSESDPKLQTVKGKKIRVSTIDKLREEGLLSMHAKYICDACVSYVEVKIYKDHMFVLKINLKFNSL
jgi:hypothetical protein